MSIEELNRRLERVKERSRLTDERAEEAIARVKAQVAQNELQQFKQKVIACIERCEQVLETSGQGTIEDLACTEKCLHDIVQLCQEEVKA